MAVKDAFINYYKELGVARDADQEQIKKAYRSLSLIKHPDKNRSKNATQEFQELQGAYDILFDPELRFIYNVIYDSHITGSLRKAARKEARKRKRESNTDVDAEIDEKIARTVAGLKNKKARETWPGERVSETNGDGYAYGTGRKHPRLQLWSGYQHGDFRNPNTPLPFP